MSGPGPAVGDLLGRQVDGVSCGPSVLVVTAALTGSGWPGVVGSRFADARRTAHRQANRFWPRALGTTPWGMRAWLRRHAPAAGPFRVRPATAAVLRRVPGAGPAPLLVGSRLLPRHWVLVTGIGDDGAWSVYEPGSGRVRSLDPRLLVAGDDTAVARVLGWPRAWCVLLP